jgi:hypothetical protein
MEGHAPAEGALIAPRGGFVFLGGATAPGARARDAWHLALRLTTFPTTHIHHDSLSFELYAEGDDLLVDSGGPYGYGHPVRDDYFVRTRAHNTVTVDGEDQGIGACRLLRTESNPELDLVDAEHELYPGVRHRRLVVFAPGRFVVIGDWLVSETTRHYEHWMHFAPGVEVTREGGTVIARRPGSGPGLRMELLGRDAPVVELIRGREQPRQGWICTGDLSMIPAWVACAAKRGARASFVTLLVPEPPGIQPVVRARLLRDPPEGTLDAEIERDGRGYSIRIDAVGPPRMETARYGAGD